MYFAMLVVFIVNGSLRVQDFPAESMEQCWEMVAKTDATSVPDYATLTCVSLRAPKAI